MREGGSVPAAQAEHQVQRRLLLDVVVRERAAVLELLAGEDEPLLVGRDALLVLDLALDVVDGVAALHLERDGLAGERLDENLHAAAQAEHQVQRRLLLDVVVLVRSRRWRWRQLMAVVFQSPSPTWWRF